jgi:transposase
MADFRRILELLLQDHSYREVVAAVGCSHRDVAAAKRVLEERTVTTAGLAAMTGAELSELFPDGRSRVSREYGQPDFSAVADSLRHNRHFTLLQGWRWYVGRESDLRKYGYAQYCHLFNEYALKHDIVAILHYASGRAMFVDWAGDTVPLVDSLTGDTVKAYLFVAVLPYSGYVFVRAFMNQKMEAWIDAHARAFSFYGGVPAITVPDNAATATHRKKRGDAARSVTEKYRQFADHYGTAIVPARVNRATDKAAVEGAVNTVYKRILGYLLEDIWTTLDDVNDAITERLFEVNHGIRRTDGSTRFERYEAEELRLLKPLPAEALEEVTWKELKAGRN